MSADRTSVTRARSEVAGGRIGAVAAGHAIAADAAMDVLSTGGNAIDAAIAASAVQCVVEMPWCGVAGDAFALIHFPDGTVQSFNGSGVAPLAVDGVAAAAGVAKVPRFGPLSVGVPGLVDAWVQLSERHGTRPLRELLAPAVRCAADGVPLDDRLVEAFSATDADESLAPIRALAPTVLTRGASFRQPDLATVLERVSTEGHAGFYGGPVARAIAEHLRAAGGALDLADLAAHRGTWTVPMQTRYRDTTVFSQPPVSMGVLLLVALRLVEQTFPKGLPDDLAELTDELVRIKHVVFNRALPLVGDPSMCDADPADLLTDAWIAGHRAVAPQGSTAGGADTTSLAVTDADGMTVSFIHSLFNEFGARELVPGTGLVLNDRLANLRVDATSPNGLRGGRRPMHTLHGYVARTDSGRVTAGATPGGRGQVQTNLQVLLALTDRGRSLGEAVDAPRWVNGLPRRAPDDDTLYVEADFPADAVATLTDRGHRIEITSSEADDHFGACTVVSRDERGCTAVADFRRSAAARAH